MNRQKRANLSVRLQPYGGTLLAEVADWLNSLPKEEKNRLIGEAMIMAYLPYARASRDDVSETEIARCCWETQNMLDKHGFNLRQSLRVAQPQWHSNSISQGIEALSLNERALKDVSESLPSVELEDEDREIAPVSLVEGEGEFGENDIFGDDDFG